LAARVAQMSGADCLILLSDVEGLFTADPNKDPKAQFIQQVREITPAIEAGRNKHPVRRLEEGARCTWFVPHATPVAARKQWIAGTLRPAGAIIIDTGALKALHEGKSL